MKRKTLYATLVGLLLLVQIVPPALAVGSSYGFTLFENSYGSGGNGVGFFPGNTANGQNPEFFSYGDGDNFGISFRHKGNWFNAFHSSATGKAKVKLYPANDEVNGVLITTADSMSSSYEYSLPQSTGASGQVVYTTGNGVTKFGLPISTASAVAVFNSTPNLLKSYGVTSVSRTSTGVFVVTLSTATSDANSIVIPQAWGNGTAVFASATQTSTTTITINTYLANGTLVDPTQIHMIVHGQM